MEIKEYIRIIRKDLNFFLSFSLVFMACFFLYVFLSPVSFTTSINLNITRSGSQETENYKYDDYYRLQADEKFAETLVGWLRSPRVSEDILKSSDIDSGNFSLKNLSRAIKAEKISSQMIAVTFKSKDQKSAKKIAQSISESISEETAELNKDQREEAWFKVIFDQPVTREDSLGAVAIVAASFSSFFIAFWIVMLRHYLKR